MKNPQDCNFPADMPDRTILVHGKSCKVGKRVTQRTQESYPRKRKCPVCSTLVPSTDQITDCGYSTDSQRPWLSFRYDQVTHCPTCGERHDFQTEFLVKPPEWDSLEFKEEHDDSELVPAEPAKTIELPDPEDEDDP